MEEVILINHLEIYIYIYIYHIHNVSETNLRGHFLPMKFENHVTTNPM